MRSTVMKFCPDTKNPDKNIHLLIWLSGIRQSLIDRNHKITPPVQVGEFGMPSCKSSFLIVLYNPALTILHNFWLRYQGT